MTAHRRSRVLLAAAAGLLVLLPACSDNDSTSSPQSAPNANTISVHGIGTVRVEPDVLDIVFAAEGNALTAKAAYDEMAAASEQIAKVVKDAGVDKKDIQSSQIYLNPTYDYTDGRTRLTGYTASITITVRLRKPEKASDILDGAAAVTGDALRLRGMSWSVDDPSKALDEARTAAMKDAQARAETLAKAGGADLGRVITIVESSQNVSPPPFDGGSKDEGAGPSVVIEPGTESIVVNVDVIYEID